MPVAGRKPKPEGQKRNRVKPTYDWVEVVDVPFDGDRPEADPDWPARTRRWWSVLSTMPHCVLWRASDWEFALDTAEIAAKFHAGDLKLAAELRARDKILGTTADARRDLRIRYVDAVTAETPANVTAIGEYRDMVGA